ncbi:MAG: hypothetical protein HXY27_01700 [Hydrogenophilaceae bacterium]|nr:hypothetical protein [Hydrogenophilaceae bacterium]
MTQSLDHGLTFHERIAMKLHLMICRNCARFMKQMHLLRSWLRIENEAEQPGLTDEARQRIAGKLREEE